MCVCMYSYVSRRFLPPPMCFTHAALQQLESARQQLLPRLHVLVALAPSEAAARPLPHEVVDVALGLIEAAIHVLVADQRMCDDSSWDSEDDQPLEDQQGPGSAYILQSSPTTPVQQSFTIGILETYRDGSLETRKQLMRGSLCVLALSSLQPRSGPDGHGVDGDGGASDCSRDGGCTFLPSPAVRQLQLDRMFLLVFHGWAELTLVEIKSCSNGTCKRRHTSGLTLEPTFQACPRIGTLGHG